MSVVSIVDAPDSIGIPCMESVSLEIGAAEG
jgi:hypothetical protein